jgi:hypothetical protein
VSGWIADFFRFFWALLYWNGRKSYFRLRRGRSVCPCQSPSDSGRARETHCEACALWVRPKRFQRVCPLLVETPDGLRCSANAADVRPFWKIALRYYGGSLAALFVVTTLAAFVALRVIGYPVSYVSVAWPPAWSQINVARGRFFLEKGHAALAANNLKEAIFSFSLAHQLAPRDYDIGFALASLWQITHPQLSDQYYAELLRDHPDRNDRTADAWHRALLARGDYRVIKLLAAQQFTHSDAIHAGYWMHTLLFAAQQTGDVSPLQVLLQGRPRPEPQWRKILETELLARTGHADQAIAELRKVWPEATHPYVPFYQIDSLIDLGRPRIALELLDAYGPRLRDDERYRLRLRAYAMLGWPTLLASDVELLLTARPTAPVIELLGTHLARNPDPALLHQVFARLAGAPLALTPDNHPAFAALFCAAGVARDFDRMREMAIALKKINGTSPRTITAFEDFLEGKSPQARIESFLPSLPLPLELTYVMLARYAAGEPAAPLLAKP